MVVPVSLFSMLCWALPLAWAKFRQSYPFGALIPQCRRSIFCPCGVYFFVLRFGFFCLGICQCLADHAVGEPAPCQSGSYLLPFALCQLCGIVAFHQCAGIGQLRVFLPVLLALGKQSFHRFGGRAAVNAFGVQIIQNCTAALALAQQLRRTAAAALWGSKLRQSF